MSHCLQDWLKILGLSLDLQLRHYWLPSSYILFFMKCFCRRNNSSYGVIFRFMNVQNWQEGSVTLFEIFLFMNTLHVQLAVMKRSRRHLVDSDEFLPSNFEGRVMDAVTLSIAYQKMKTLCFNMKNEILTDIEIYDQHVLPRYSFF